MRRLFVLLFITLLSTTALSQGLAQEIYPTTFHIEMETMKHAGPPQVQGDYVLFSYSAPHTILRVGVAFEHENYNKVHTFSRNPHDVFVLPYEPPEGLDRLVYRMIIDGIWTRDPNNPNTIRTEEDVNLSYLHIPSNKEKTAMHQPNTSGKVTFTFRSDDASHVSLAGNFNQWDPYMYRLKKVPDSDGLFSITLSLPKGTYYYYYIVDGRRVTDPDNPNKVLESTGHNVSVIRVSG